jgi:hypothetical protein
MIEDFFGRVLSQLLLNLIVKIIERYASREYAGNVVHAIQERLASRGPLAATRSAFGALLQARHEAAGSRYEAVLSLLLVLIHVLAAGMIPLAFNIANRHREFAVPLTIGILFVFGSNIWLTRRVLIRRKNSVQSLKGKA